MDIIIYLTEKEIEDIYSPSVTKGTGGYQNLFKALRKSINGQYLRVSEKTAKRIIKYSKYTSGGWQSRLRSIARKVE